MIQSDKEMMKFLNLEVEMELLSIRSSNFTIYAKLILIFL